MTTKQALSPKLSADLQAALVAGALPDFWLPEDDQCDCVIQRVGQWTNPYLPYCLTVRLCCLWRELYRQFPQFVQEVPAAYDVARHRWQKEARTWDSEDYDMPKGLWYRHVALREGISLEEARKRCRKGEFVRPKRVEKGRGRESAPEPTADEVTYGHRERLRAAGYID